MRQRGFQALCTIQGTTLKQAPTMSSTLQLAEGHPELIAAVRACRKLLHRRALVAAGGVAANHAIRGALQDVAARAQTTLIIPPPALCTDNGAMIAWAGLERLATGDVDDLNAPARPRWPLDPAAEAVRGAGVKA